MKCYLNKAELVLWLQGRIRKSHYSLIHLLNLGISPKIVSSTAVVAGVDYLLPAGEARLDAPILPQQLDQQMANYTHNSVKSTPKTQNNSTHIKIRFQTFCQINIIQFISTESVERIVLSSHQLFTFHSFFKLFCKLFFYSLEFHKNIAIK